MSSDPTERFSIRVENYRRHRPRYPLELMRLLAVDIGLVPAHIIADIGSGTGILSLPFLEYGNTVYGVEPNAPMRAAAEADLRGYDRFHSVDGRAEATTLEQTSVDVIVAGQAFHWFDADAARTEFERILRPRGWVVLVWNVRRFEGTAFLEAYEALVRRHGTDYDPGRFDEAAVEHFFGDCGFASASLENIQRLDLEGIAGRLLSSSYAPEAGDPRHAPMRAELETIFKQYSEAGRVELHHDTRVIWGQL